MEEENQAITSMKNLPTQMGGGGEKPNDFGRGSVWSEEAQGSIQEEDASDAWKMATSLAADKMWAMQWGELHYA